MAAKTASTRVANTRMRVFLILISDPTSIDFFLQEEINFCAFTAADPVALHDTYFFRPSFELVQSVQQFLGVSGDAEKPLLQVALLHLRVFVAPAAAIDYLLIGHTVAHPGHQFPLLCCGIARPLSDT